MRGKLHPQSQEGTKGLQQKPRRARGSLSCRRRRDNDLGHEDRRNRKRLDQKSLTVRQQSSTFSSVPLPHGEKFGCDRSKLKPKLVKSGHTYRLEPATTEPNQAVRLTCLDPPSFVGLSEKRELNDSLLTELLSDFPEATAPKPR